MSLNLLKLLSSEDLSILVDKINQNFDLLSANGGGPPGSIGETGRTGFVGPPGGPGPSGGAGIQGSVWMYATELPSSVTENLTPDIYASITPSTPRKGDFLIITKRDGDYSKTYRFETNSGSPTVPVWNEVVELNTQNALYLKLDIFRFNDFTRTFPGPATTYKSICFEDNSNAKNYQNRLYLQNRKDYLIFTGDNLSSGQNLTNFQTGTIDELLAKNEYTDDKLPKGKFNILSGDNPHMTFLYFQDQLDTENITYPLAGDNIISDVFKNTDPLKKLAFNGQWSTLKMTENGTLIFESTGDVQINPKTNNQPNGKLSIFGKTLVLQGTTIIDQTLGYAPVGYFNATTGNTILLPKNTYNSGTNPNGQVELAIYPKTPVTSIPGILALNNFTFDATSKFSGLGTAQEGKELLGFLDINLEKLGTPTSLSPTNRKILTAGGQNNTPFGYDFKKLEDLSIPEKDRPNVFQKRLKLYNWNNIASSPLVADITDQAALPLGSNLLRQGSTDIYGRQIGAITTTNDGNLWNITATLTNNVIINRVYILSSQTDDPSLPIAAMKGLKLTFKNSTTKNLIFKRVLGVSDGVLISGKWSTIISSNPNSTADILPGYDVITVKPGDTITMTVQNVFSGTLWSYCHFDLDSTSDITSSDGNRLTGMQFKDGKKYTVTTSPALITNPAQKESSLYPTQNQLILGQPNYTGELVLDATSDIHVVYSNPGTAKTCHILGVNLPRLGPNLKYGTMIKVRLDSSIIGSDLDTSIRVTFVRESQINTYAPALSTTGFIVIPDYEFNMIQSNLGNYATSPWFVSGGSINTMQLTYRGYNQSTELELMYRDTYYHGGAAVTPAKPHFILVNHSVIIAGIIGQLNGINTSLANVNNYFTNKFNLFHAQQWQDYGGLLDYPIGVGLFDLGSYIAPANGKVHITYNSSVFIPDLNGILSYQLQIRVNTTIVAIADVYHQSSEVYFIRIAASASWAGNINAGDNVNFRINVTNLQGGDTKTARGSASLIFIPS